jgi:hypothetical protein|tara:strand:+ start:376 stop:609 length:234 start_codon:yes stop_codon:yes gene_type:complete
MDYVLSQRLPAELVDIICRDVHRRYMKDICNQIKFNIVWIRLKNEMPSFLIGTFKNNQYYALLDYDNILGATYIMLR